ncbi:12162_t:CDS:2 [Rhizophagus irregularis]|nr:12162_t:CDS:2 [Rhizophagus irregularis]
MNYSRNIRAHALYSGILGAFLEPSENGGNNNMTHHLTRDETLQQAATWLSQNNPYLRPYASMISSLQNQISNGPFPTARHAETDLDAPPVNTCEIIIPNYDFPDEVHNEDFHYTRLMAGFIQDSDTSRIPISTYDPNLEPLLFPDIFTDVATNEYRSQVEDSPLLAILVIPPARKTQASSKHATPLETITIEFPH